MFTKLQINQAKKDALLLIISFKSIDTLVFRKLTASISCGEREQVVTASKEFLKKHPIAKSILKNHIDNSEMHSSFYHNYPRKFRGSYSNVIINTFAGLMLATI